MKLKELRKIDLNTIFEKRWDIGKYENLKITGIKFTENNVYVSTDVKEFFNQETTINEHKNTTFKLKCCDYDCSNCPLDSVCDASCSASDLLIDICQSIFDKLSKKYSEDSVCLLRKDVLKDIIKEEQKNDPSFGISLQ